MEYIVQYFDVLALGIGLLLLIFSASVLGVKEKKIFVILIGLVFILSLFEYLETLFDDLHTSSWNIQRYIFSFICYSIRPAILALVFYLIVPIRNKKIHLLWIPVAVNMIVYFMCFFTKWVFWYDENNIFHETFMGYTVYLVCGLYIIALTVYSILESKISKIRSTILFSMLIFAVISIIVSRIAKLEYTIVIDALMISLTFYYMFISYQFVYQKAIEHSQEMNAKNTALMLSQIQPHFIYNTLATIQVLYDVDPELASDTISDFSMYLRTNLDSLDKTKPVPIMDEVKHAECYAKIEKLRFDTIQVIFDIQDKSFFLPVLTIQPMVENAIKYGVRGLKNGTVWIKTYEENKKHYLVIEDNGRGFDVDEMGRDGKNHVGVNNVKSRIENMVNGTFNIESEVGKGTKVTIVIDGE